MLYPFSGGLFGSSVIFVVGDVYLLIIENHVDLEVYPSCLDDVFIRPWIRTEFCFGKQLLVCLLRDFDDKQNLCQEGFLSSTRICGWMNFNQPLRSLRKLIYLCQHLDDKNPPQMTLNHPDNSKKTTEISS